MYLIARVVNAGLDKSSANDVRAAQDKDWFGPVAPDADEDNDSFATAFDLGSVTGTQTRADRTIDAADDVDWYCFTMQRTGTSQQKVQIDFADAEGDLALALYSGDGTFIRQVDGNRKNKEEIKLTSLPAGTYFLRVLSSHGDVCRGYKLTVIA
jgi:hypothetical protein